jgi:hypothetical protein
MDVIIKMSELAVIGTIFHSIQKENNINLKRLMEILSTREIDDRFESPDFVANLVTRLIKMHVIAGNVYSDGEFSLEKLLENSNTLQMIIKLRNLHTFSRDFDEFKDLILTSELNRFFIDENEMKQVFQYVNNEMKQGSFDL